MTELALLGGEGFSLERLRADEAAARPDRCSASVVEAQPSAASESEPSTSGSSDKHINGFIYHKVRLLGFGARSHGSGRVVLPSPVSCVLQDCWCCVAVPRAPHAALPDSACRLQSSTRLPDWQSSIA